jgi:nucleotide-binding universal stress UspA family protein
MSALLQRLLLATDGSADASLAARAASDLAGITGAELHVVHVWRDLRPAGLSAAAAVEHPRAARKWEQEAWELLDDQTRSLRNTGTPAAGVHLREGRPAEEIAELAEQLDADLVVLGSRGIGAVRRLVVGSVSEGVVGLAPCPVLVVPGGEGAWPPPRIVAGADTSEEAEGAVGLALNLGGALGLEVLVVTAYPEPTPFGRGETPDAPARADPEGGRAWVARSRSSAGPGNVIEARLRTRAVFGDAAAVILDAAEEGERPALVVVGRRGIGAVRRFVLGGVSSDVMRSVRGPVLIVPSTDAT